MKLFDSLLNAIGSVLVLCSVSIAFLGVTWNAMKPIIEQNELKYIQEIKDLNISKQ